MKKNGFTVVELIVSFALTMLVSALLFQMLITLRNVYVDVGVKGQLLTKQALLSSKINFDFNNRKVSVILKCGANCVRIFFDDNSSKELIVDKANNQVKYGTYTTKLVPGSSFRDIEVYNETVFPVTSNKNDSVFVIKVPIFHKDFPSDYGLSIVYQYNSRNTSISNVVFDSSSSTSRALLVKGPIDMFMYEGGTYTEFGYYVLEANGTITDTSSDVTISGSVGDVAGETYTITYTLRTGGTIVDVKTRKVTILPAV